MLLEAYVLVQTADGSAPIAPDLRAVSGVSFADELRGPYAAIARTSSSNLLVVVQEIRRLPGVTRVVASAVNGSSETELDESAA